MNEKRNYETLDVRIYSFDKEDIVCASTGEVTEYDVTQSWKNGWGSQG